MHDLQHNMKKNLIYSFFFFSPKRLNLDARQKISLLLQGTAQLKPKQEFLNAWRVWYPA